MINLNKISTLGLLELIHGELIILYIEGNYGAMAIGAKINLQRYCDELNKRNYTAKTINTMLNNIKKQIKQGKKVISITMNKKNE